jgi:hypothetical protein
MKEEAVAMQSNGRFTEFRTVGTSGAGATKLEGNMGSKGGAMKAPEGFEIVQERVPGKGTVRRMRKIAEAGAPAAGDAEQRTIAALQSIGLSEQSAAFAVKARASDWGGLDDAPASTSKPVEGKPDDAASAQARMLESFKAIGLTDAQAAAAAKGRA